MKLIIMLMTAMTVFSYASKAQHVSDFDIRHFNSENGLPQNSIKAIAPDEYGFIWLASEAGLLRYDGQGFKNYNRKNTDIPTSRILSIIRAPGKKDLLAITESRKVLLINKGRASAYYYSFDTAFMRHEAHTRYSNDSILGLAFRRYKYMPGQELFLENGNKIILSLSGEIQWHRSTRLISRTKLKPLKDFSTVFVLGNAIFLSHNKLSAGTIKRCEPGKVREVHITGDFIRASKGGRLEETSFITNYATKAAFLLSGSDLYSVNLLPDGNLNTKLLLSGFDLPAHQIICAHYDPVKDRLFLGSVTEGLFVFTRNRFFTALYPDKDPFANVQYSLVPLSDSSVLSGSGMVFFTKKGAKPQFREAFRRNANYGYELFRSSQKGIGFGYGVNTYLLDYTARNIIGEFKFVFASAFSERVKNDIWIGTIDSGIYRLDSANWLSRIHPFINRSQCMVWETDSVCWIGTENYLFRYSYPSGRIDTFPEFNDKIVRSIHIAGRGEIWVCCYENGLYLLKDGKLSSFSTNEYPALNTVHKILEDDKGYFWISTNDGLYQVSRNDLLHHHRDSTFKPYFFRYSSEDGFLTNEFNGSRQHSGTKLVNGFFAFPSMKGVVFFPPSATLPELPAEAVIIDRIVVDGREMDPERFPVTIERGFGQITITPATAYLGNPANLKYEFKLNNSNKWQTLTGGSIVFSALSSGKNHVTIRKRSGFGEQGYVYNTLDIYIPPAWWEHTWFYLILLVLLFLLFWMTVWFRTRYWKQRSQRFELAVQNRMVELNEMILELERSEEKLSDQLHFQRMLNENITHDINAPLKYLTIYTGEVLKQSIDNKLPDPGTVEHIHNATRNIHALAENLTGFLKTKYKQPSLANINVRNLVEQKLELFSIGAKRKNILLKNEIDYTLLIKQNETLFGILLHNLIDNALKNTVKGSVLITSLQRKDGKVSLRISDTGRGLSEEQVLLYNTMFNDTVTTKSSASSGFGFIIVKEIAKILQVSIHIESVLNEGTEIIVTIPE